MKILIDYFHQHMDLKNITKLYINRPDVMIHLVKYLDKNLLNDETLKLYLVYLKYVN